ncbi:hypothetical protein EV368DRAFT_65260 [Lentinula lateritia]|nr:hypothetical protein EV368DRAFT_65260 [Lentinula lateritia]
MDDILPQVESWLLGNYAQAAVITLCVADHIETWPREFSSIWKRRKTGISILFLVNRYMLLLNLMVQAVSNFPGNGTDEQCQALNLIYSICAFIALVATNASAFIIARFALDIWSTALGVNVSTIESPFQNLSRCGLMVNNGDQYIQLMLAVAIIIAIFSAVSLKSGNTNNFGNFVTPFFDILPNLLISHLMLNLRTYSEPGNTTISQGQQTHISSLDFASNQMLGNIGAPLDGGPFNEEEEKEEERVEMEAIGGQNDRSAWVLLLSN